MKSHKAPGELWKGLNSRRQFLVHVHGVQGNVHLLDGVVCSFQLVLKLDFITMGAKKGHGSLVVGWRESLPHIHSSVEVPVLQPWAQLPSLGIVTWCMDLQSHSELTQPPLCYDLGEAGSNLSEWCRNMEHGLLKRLACSPALCENSCHTSPFAICILCL